MKKLNRNTYLSICLLLLLSLIFSSTTIAQLHPRGYSSPEVHSDKTVTFNFRAPRASEVKLNTQCLSEEVVMQKGDNGVWSITVGPVVPDIYPYHFVVDGIGVADPINPDIFPNEGFKNSLVEIPGDSPGVADIKNIPHGTVARRYYHSDVLDVRSLLVYTPPGYEKSTTKNYPVLYLLHGSTDTEETWTKVGRANIIIDNLIEQGKAESMIIIMPYGRAYPKYGFDSGSLRDSANLFEFHKDFTENILPFVEGNYRIKKGPKSRAITGFSGGGGESLFIGLS
ncbi:MAG TPA: alpha/beta hydrolase-fold protein, partial [Draconibacterium sp.]|nr:alpha/beta hydrolase-fold protein [Draconibacterium sp.]